MSADDSDRLLEIGPVPGPPDAVLIAPPSKSLTHRAILLGLLTPHTIIENPLVAADTVASLRLVHALGARTSAEPATPAGSRLLATLSADGAQPVHALHPGADGDRGTWDGIVLDAILARVAPETPRPLLAARIHLHVEGPLRPAVHTPRVDLGNSGTTLRLGSALAALADRPITLDGDGSLRTRPMAPLLDALRALGATADATGDGRPPITIRGPLAGGAATLDGRVSSQFVSAVLVAAQALPQGVALELPGAPASRPYIALTMEMLARFGGHVKEEADGARLRYLVPAAPRRTHPLKPTRYRVPGDWSSAAFPLVAAALTGGRVRLAGLDPESPQGDRAILDILRAAGCAVEWQPSGRDGPLLVVTAPADGIEAFTHTFTDTPDLLPALAVLAARAHGTSHLERVGHVRVKETDRVAAMTRGLRALGFTVQEESERMEIEGDPRRPLPRRTIHTEADHRILMAFAVLALTGPGPVRLTEPGCYHVSYPGFRLDVDALGGASRVVGQGDEDAQGMKEGRVDDPKATGKAPGETR